MQLKGADHMNKLITVPLGVTYRAPADVKPYANNSRAHTRAQIKNVVRSVETSGWTQR